MKLRMRLPFLVGSLTAAVASAASAGAPAPAESSVAWQPWSEAAFAKAKAEHKLVLLDLEAVWCHWCHVMDEVTYRNPEVLKLIRAHVVAIRVDQDSRPDLANRYEDYGWPATILYGSSGAELAKRSGYLPPEAMASMLTAFLADQTPGPSVQAEAPLTYATTTALPAALSAELRRDHDGFYDEAGGGWGQGHKYLESQSAEYALALAEAGDAREAERLKATLKLEHGLIDPVWGGAYQYSAGGRWSEPHFEKIMQVQAETMRLYALAAGEWGDPAALVAAQQIRGFVERFLTSPEGAFYTSMDADVKPGEHSAGYFQLDDAGRRKLGLPRVDTHRYARENGWMVHGLCALYAASGDASALTLAQRAARWTEANRALSGGGYRHGESDPGGPYLGDTLAMGRAYLSLYLAAGDRADLARSVAAARFIAQAFANPGGAGFATAKAATGDVRPPAPNRDEMIQLARYANLLARVTGDAAPRATAEAAMRFLATPAVAGRLPTGGVLLAADELAREPTHVTVVGPKGDARAAALFAAALRYPDHYLRVEWWDKREGALPQSDVSYPELAQPAAFACTGSRCSLPITDPAALAAKVKRLSKRTD